MVLRTAGGGGVDKRVGGGEGGAVAVGVKGEDPEAGSHAHARGREALPPPDTPSASVSTAASTGDPSSPAETAPDSTPTGLPKASAAGGGRESVLPAVARSDDPAAPARERVARFSGATRIAKGLSATCAPPAVTHRENPPAAVET